MAGEVGQEERDVALEVALFGVRKDVRFPAGLVIHPFGNGQPELSRREFDQDREELRATQEVEILAGVVLESSEDDVQERFAPEVPVSHDVIEGPEAERRLPSHRREQALVDSEIQLAGIFDRTPDELRSLPHFGLWLDDGSQNPALDVTQAGVVVDDLPGLLRSRRRRMQGNYGAESMLSRKTCLLLLAGTAALPLAAQGPPTVPEPLRPWVPWVLERHPDLACPLLDGRRLCAWPGRLALDLDDRGGTFELEVAVDRETDLALPGGPAFWPRDVTSGGEPALLRRLGDQPAVALAPGRHRVSGRFRWSRLPESLPVPRAIALVDLTLAGTPVRSPRREDGGLLWLASARREEGEQDRLSLEVERRIEDGVPVTLTTRLRLRVSGSSRAVDLGSPLLAGFTATALGGELPLRWTESERLVAQVRPGTWTLTLRARSREPVTSLALDDRPAPWPDEELWAFQADPAVRAVRVSGAPGVDPQRTSLPEEWKSLPVYRLATGAALTFDVLRRGEAQPPPDAVDVSRVWWLEQRGGQYAVSDLLTGELYRGGRLEALFPAELGRFGFGPAGHVADQVITESPGDEGHPGVEVRDRALEAHAELLYPRGGALPAVGWNRDARSLAVELRVPPGWTLVAAPGADRAGGAWVDRWTLLDLFLLLILSLATWRLDGRLWGLLAFVFLGLAWHEPRATALAVWWLVLLPLRGLLGVLGADKARWVRRLRWAVLVGFTVQLAVFCADQWRTGLFPQLERTRRRAPSPFVLGGAAAPEPSRQTYKDMAVEAAKAPEEEGRRALPAAPEATAEESRAHEVDPNAVVQTGPGIPSWTWRTYRLSWTGPVTADQSLRLLLISPWLERVLSLLRIAAAVLVGWCLIHPRKTPGAVGARSAVPVSLVFFLTTFSLPLPAAAQEPAETPPAGLLAELEHRLTAPPACHPDCVEVSRLLLDASPGGLAVAADVHAAARSAWRLPGPAAAWTPARVTVDGARTAALRLGDDGFFLLRLEPGVHRVELAGAARNSLALEFPLRPRILDFRGDGWTIDGWRRDEPPPAAVRLDRQLPSTGALAEGGDEAFEPWLELQRRIEVGVRWRLESELRRRGPPGQAVLVRVPLLPGEWVTTAGIPIEEGEAVVALEPDETARRFESTLEEAGELELTAPRDRPWLERWELRCSPIWHCSTAGLAPTVHMQDGSWRPLWQPWPGERVTLSFVRPPGAPGRATTFDSAVLVVKPGRRLLEGELTVALRTSLGGEQTIDLPPRAALQSFTIDGGQQPVQAAEGRLAFTLEPGAHRVAAAWRQDHRTGAVERVPPVGLGGGAVDVTVRVELPRNRWLLWAGGPGWGPVVQFWQYLLVLALAAWALGRWAPSPLKIHDWLLLGAGLTQVPFAAALVVVGWLLVLALRHYLRTRRWWTYDALQLALLAAGLIALAVLYAAIHSGLLLQPDMQVLAPGDVAASSSRLAWYVDRSGAALPRPWVLSLPLWVWRILMLVWSLWLASRLLRWAPWCWHRLTPGPLLATPRAFRSWREEPQ